MSAKVDPRKTTQPTAPKPPPGFKRLHVGIRRALQPITGGVSLADRIAIAIESAKCFGVMRLDEAMQGMTAQMHQLSQAALLLQAAERRFAEQLEKEASSGKGS